MFKMLRNIALFFSFVAFVGTAAANRWIWCTDYVAAELGIGLYGDAKTWWDDSTFTSTGYTKSSTPVVGSIVVFNSWDSNPYGHVGVVRQIVSSSEILIDHSNWHWDGSILQGVGVKKYSGSWTQVKVKYNPGDSTYPSTPYPVRGFLVPPSSSYSVIGINSPYFIDSCIRTSPVDSRCVTYDIALWKQCWDAPFVLSPLCEYGIGGGNYATALPDFIMNKAWLLDDAGNVKTTFSPGQHVQMKGQAKNTGKGNSTGAITVKFYRSNGEKVDSNKQEVGSDTIQASSLPSGSTHTETEGLYVPTTPGTYNIVVCADTGHAVGEEIESNNCSTEAVFKVDDFAWLIPILNIILED